MRAGPIVINDSNILPGAVGDWDGGANGSNNGLDALLVMYRVVKNAHLRLQTGFPDKEKGR